METSKTVSWKTYAEQYDLLLEYNPFYQQLHQQVMDLTDQWQIGSRDLLVDVGAGTGNYSLALAKRFPQAEVLHIDNDEGMNARTIAKREERGIINHFILDLGIDAAQLEPESVKALVSIHALYTFPDPQAALRKMYSWLQPNGQAILVNAGRIVNVMSWQLAIGSHLIRNYGLRKTLRILAEGKEVSKQNAYIRDMQRKGMFWTHSHQEFLDVVTKAGFIIEEAGITFRGISDWVAVRKQCSLDNVH